MPFTDRAQLQEMLFLGVLVIEKTELLSGIDEALSHLRLASQDRYGNRLDWRKRESIEKLMNELLERRFELTHSGK